MIYDKKTRISNEEKPIELLVRTAKYIGTDCLKKS